jgi:hypothetical protein
MSIGGDGKTKFKILEGTCPQLISNLKKYRKKVVLHNGIKFVTDEPQTRGEIHAAQCAEYLIAYEPVYHAPPKTHGPEPWWVKWLEQRKKRQRGSKDSFINLGPKGKLP